MASWAKRDTRCSASRSGEPSGVRVSTESTKALDFFNPTMSKSRPKMENLPPDSRMFR